MKKYLFLLTLLLVYAISVQAGIFENFYDTYTKKGMDQAVEQALKDGKSPDDIVKIAITLKGISYTSLIRALYCAGAKGEDIRAAAEKYNIPEKTVVVGYKQNIDECYKNSADSQRYNQSFSEPSGSRNGTYASPSKF
jgi:hypothetical protein